MVTAEVKFMFKSQKSNCVLMHWMGFNDIVRYLDFLRLYIVFSYIRAFTSVNVYLSQ